MRDVGAEEVPVRLELGIPGCKMSPAHRLLFGPSDSGTGQGGRGVGNAGVMERT